jgi:inorganic pyrophosphatase
VLRSDARGSGEERARPLARAQQRERLTMLRRFFQDYKLLEGKAVEVDEIQPAKVAYPIIEDALGRYSRQRRRGFK